MISRVLALLLLAAPAAALDLDAEPAAPTGEQAGWSADGWLSRYFELKDSDADAALDALLQARRLGGAPQRVALEMGWLALQAGDVERAEREFKAARAGEDAKLTAAADAELTELAVQWLAQARKLRQAGDLDGVEMALARAQALGAPAARVHLEMAWQSLADGDVAGARAFLTQAAESGDPVAAGRAEAQLRVLPDPDAKPPPIRLSSELPPAPLSSDGPPQFQRQLPSLTGDRTSWDAARWLNVYYQRRADRDAEGALEALLRARDSKGSRQLVAMELGYAAVTLGDLLEAERWFRRGAEGRDSKLARSALNEILAGSGRWMQRGSDAARAGQTEAADVAFAQAARLGVPEQEIQLTRGFLALENGKVEAARRLLGDAATGPDPALGDRANRQLVALSPDDDAPAPRLPLVDRDAPGLFDFPLPAPPRAQRNWTAGDWLDHYYGLKARRVDGATMSLLRARAQGGSPQATAAELGFVALSLGDLLEATRQFQLAAHGEDAGLAERAEAQLRSVGDRWIDAGAAYSALGRLDEAGAAFALAEQTGANPQRLALGRGYLALSRRQSLAAEGVDASKTYNPIARAQFLKAMRGDDPMLAAAGRREMWALPQPWYGRASEQAVAGDYAAAQATLDAAEAEGNSPQHLALGRGRVARIARFPVTAAGHFEDALAGEDSGLRSLAKMELELLPTDALAAAGKLRTAEDWTGALDAIDVAERYGADPQLVALERGYTYQQYGKPAEAGRQYRLAAEGSNDDVAATARAQRRSLQRLFWGEVYGEVYGWYRFHPRATTLQKNLVPLLRVRGYIHPIPKLDLDPYIFFQISRDTESKVDGPNGFPLILADNTMMFGGGVLFRFWKKRVGLFAQIGPAYHLIPRTTRPRWELDFRAGAFIGLESPKCRPEPALGKPGARAIVDPCFDLWSELVYVSRFDHNLFFTVRGRASLNYLVTGPVVWAPVAEVRAFKDIDNDFWNNLVDAGIAHRWRLVYPFPLDLMLGVHGGTYYGLANLDPAPNPLTYAEFRLQLATSISF